MSGFGQLPYMKDNIMLSVVEENVSIEQSALTNLCSIDKVNITNKKGTKIL